MAERGMELASVNAAAPRRRVVRKGTKSCWECKRRKTRCTFRAPVGSVCDGCKSRQVKCIGQEFDHNETTIVRPRSDQTTQISPRKSMSGCVYDTCLGSVLSTSLAQAAQSLGRSGTPVAHEDLRRTLISAWPCSDELDFVALSAAGAIALFHGIVCKPYSDVLNANSLQLQEVLQAPTVDLRPLQIVRKLLLLASFLQSTRPKSDESSGDLRAIYHRIASRAVDTASKLVTSNDDLVDSIEGIECIMIESMYLNNAGLLRQAWLKTRRALLLAQAMGLHMGRIQSSKMRDVDTHKRVDLYYMWFRLVCSDRYLSLMLGLPQGSRDNPFATLEALQSCAPIDRMERVQAVVGGHILERKKEELYSLLDTNELDKMLMDAATSMPAQWWLSPDAASFASSNLDGPSELVRLMLQITHFHLLAQLHLPYLLQVSVESIYDYSKLTAVSASREVLSRFLMVRRINEIAAYCRGVDFLAFLASTTLCLAHIEVHRHASSSTGCALRFLAHQRLGDRGLLERTLETFVNIIEDEEDVLARKIVGMLEALLAAEAAAANGETYHVTLAVLPIDQLFERGDHARATGFTFHIDVPCIGTIKFEHSRGGYGWEAAGLDAISWREPESLVDVEDSALQGVDVALFDVLFRGVADYSAEV